MKTSMLEYSKTILEKVSFSESLFQKEYNKFSNILSGRENRELKKWIKNCMYE